MIRLLIVDDSIELLEVMKNILVRYGHTVKTLATADNIQQEISEFQPDLLILDVYLGDADGREICKTLKRNVDTRHLHILVFSASPKILKDYKSYYADDFMEKPFDLKILMEKIKSVRRYSHDLQLK